MWPMGGSKPVSSAWVPSLQASVQAPRDRNTHDSQGPGFHGPPARGKAHHIFVFLSWCPSPLFVILGLYLFSPAKRVAFIFPIWQVRKSRPLRGELLKIPALRTRVVCVHPKSISRQSLSLCYPVLVICRENLDPENIRWYRAIERAFG